MINDTRPDVVWVGLGAPKQEKWMARQTGRIAAPAMIGVGAAFDFHSGNVKWAPAWIRALGLEWAYRLALEPRRMWRRNLGNLLFVMQIATQSLQRAAGATAERKDDARHAAGTTGAAAAGPVVADESSSLTCGAETGGDRKAA
jgi:N-acetylglucosaminyldiphosphoundecaprenol N-acetyl-beta-D-mannosaminyltransferase